MPQIPQYEVPASDARLSIPDSGAATLAQAGRHTGAMGAEAANSWRAGFDKLAAGVGQLGTELDAKQTAHETSQILPKLALDQTQRLQDINGIAYGTDPNQITTKLNEYKTDVINPAREQFLAGFSTTKGKEVAADAWGRYEAHLYHTAAAVSVQASGDAQRNNLVGGINKLIASTYDNPASLDYNLELTDAAIKGAVASPTMAPELKHTLTTGFSQDKKTDMVVNAIKAKANVNPDAARQMLTDDKYAQYIGPHAATLNQYITGQENHLEAKAKAQVKEVKTEQADAVKTALTEAETKTFTPNGARVGPQYLQDVMDAAHMPGAGPHTELIKSMYDWGQAEIDRQAKGINAVTDDATKHDFDSRAYLDPADKRALSLKEVFDASAQGRLSEHDFRRYNDAVKNNSKGENADANRIRNEGITQLKQIVNPKNALTGASFGDPRGGAYAEGRALSWFNRSAEAGLQSGKYKTMQDAVDDLVVNNPNLQKQFPITPADSLRAVSPAAPTAPGKKPSAFDFMFGGMKKQ